MLFRSGINQCGEGNFLEPNISSIFEQAQDSLITLRDLMRFAVSRFRQADVFFGHGTNNASQDRKNAGHTAPPQGLYLAEVYYDWDSYDVADS